VVDTTRQVASDLTCTRTDSQYFCSRDDRPADGTLQELSVTKNARGSYDVSLRTAFFDRIHGHDVDQTETIASDLAIQ
jgi:hypothetical protein